MAMRDMEARFGGLPSRLEAEEIWRNIWREETHNSTAIEGNTLVQHEVDQLLERGLTGTRTKALVEYLEVRGYADAAGGCTRLASTRQASGRPASFCR